ncbi:uncharacterized protein DSM5745_07363 [Aspergillus mulundensis]|uniref:Uncharacterized protein n=1 Tax=Aspergillus mulundensis TaxID=1810919 RepID=A0A3D8RLM5_9EURO|nr:Uncharacterized protein DSM5745_07363 [Aspergillus mulundensis]RDW74701.1 Uncharacterized protein DSM5745_07363 [Aspergillus mulundensis]
MLPVSRPEGHMSLNYIPTTQPMSGTSTGRSSPSDPSANAPIRPPFVSSNSLNGATGSIGSARLGAGSPSHELGARLYSKRAREIQAEEGVSPFWGPPTSGHSTPLRENIPESPSQEGFPDLVPSTSGAMNGPARRTRAGTVPSRFSPVGVLNEANLQQPFMSQSQSSRPTPSTSPFRPTGVSGIDTSVKPPTTLGGGGSGTGSLSRLRAGSMPQRTNILGSAGPFGPSLFSTSWATGRDRATTLTSIRSSEGPTSPSQSSFSRDGLTDSDVKTLDYLGLAETPQQARTNFVRPSVDVLLQQQQQQQQQTSSLPPLLAELAMIKNNSRIRSYSVNAKEKYADDEELECESRYSQLPSGAITPSAAATAAQLAATQAQIHQHNLAVQAFANHATANRPRARTAGILEAPPQRSSIRNYLATPSRLENSFSAADLNIAETGEYDELTEAVQMLHLGGAGGANIGLRSTAEVDEANQDGPTRALWIGSIPVSTTVTSLEAIFSMYGKIESTRVLTHKNCGFVNFERIESAIQARSLLNGKEIFPGAGAVRIGYAKVPGSSNAGTPGVNGAQSSPTPDPNSKSSAPDADKLSSGSTVPQLPALPELQPEMVHIVKEFGATEDDTMKINASIQQAISFQCFNDEIPSIPEPNQTRMFDAPRLRDIRKRIDNGNCSIQEIEETAIAMLPEIAELASDYLGNTVVQKLFEYSSEPTKERMLVPIAPHLGEIGVHKNGTWAAQKIIDVAKTPTQMRMIVDALRPYTLPLFLDQYGNYVLQCCLRFGSPFNDFVFETMLSRMWEVAQGRFGARAMRACLESHHATKDQQRMLAAAIALHSVQLATNANGALLLTWFLDTCTFPCRRTVLAPRLVPHLVHLCTHKVAYLTVLKVINQRNEPEARNIVLKALFFSPGDEVLEKILSDQTSGATLIFKVLTTPCFDESMRPEVVKNVSKVLTKLKATPSQGYKRLMDEVGMSSRGGSRDNHHRDNTSGSEKQQHRPASRQTTATYPSQPPLERQYSGQYPIMGQNLESARPMSSEQPHNMQFESYPINGVNAMNGMGGVNGSTFGQDPMVPLAQQQMQYQAYLAAQSRGVSPGLYPALGNSTYGYPAGSDNLRAMQAQPGQINSGPMLSQSPYAPQQFSPVMGSAQMYQYPPQFYSQAAPIQGQPSGGRRGRYYYYFMTEIMMTNVLLGYGSIVTSQYDYQYYTKTTPFVESQTTHLFASLAASGSGSFIDASGFKFSEKDTKPGKIKLKKPGKLGKKKDKEPPNSPGSSPILPEIDEKTMSVFPTGKPREEDHLETVVCKTCKRPVLKQNAADHIRGCIRAKQEKARKRKELRDATNRAKAGEKEGDEEGAGGDKVGEGDESVKAQKGAKKSAVKGMAEDGTKKGKKRKAEGDEENKDKEPKKKKKKEEQKPKAAKPKGPVDVEKQCGVPLPNGAQCARSLTCKSHSMGAKRAVPGRSLPYDMLLQAYQKKNQARQQKAAIDANAPLQDDLENNGPVDSDEEKDAVMAAISRSHPQPLVRHTLISTKKKYQFVRIKEMLSHALGGARGGGLFSTGDQVNSPVEGNLFQPINDISIDMSDVPDDLGNNSNLPTLDVARKTPVAAGS